MLTLLTQAERTCHHHSEDQHLKHSNQFLTFMSENCFFILCPPTSQITFSEGQTKAKLDSPQSKQDSIQTGFPTEKCVQPVGWAPPTTVLTLCGDVWTVLHVVRLKQKFCAILFCRISLPPSLCINGDLSSVTSHKTHKLQSSRDHPHKLEIEITKINHWSNLLTKHKAKTSGFLQSRSYLHRSPIITIKSVSLLSYLYTHPFSPNIQILCIKNLYGLYLYSHILVCPLLKVLLQHKSAFIHSHTHSHTKGKVTSLQRAYLLIGNSYTHKFTHQWNIHQEQRGVQYLAQGHFDMWTGGAGDRNINLSHSRPFIPLYTWRYKGY